ncbi:hypothetical protein HOY80DRAFT_897845, partial [Tuber brumale]
PSPSTNPANQCGSEISIELFLTIGRFTGIISGKRVFRTSVSPLFIEALILTNFLKPSSVRCSPSFIRYTADLNKR